MANVRPYLPPLVTYDAILCSWYAGIFLYVTLECSGQCEEEHAKEHQGRTGWLWTNPYLDQGAGAELFVQTYFYTNFSPIWSHVFKRFRMCCKRAASAVANFTPPRSTCRHWQDNRNASRCEGRDLHNILRGVYAVISVYVCVYVWFCVSLNLCMHLFGIIGNLNFAR